MNRIQRLTEALFGPGAAPELQAQVHAGLHRLRDFRSEIGADLRSYVWDRRSPINGKDYFVTMGGNPEVANGAPLLLVEHMPSRRVVVAQPVDPELYPTHEEQMWMGVTAWRLAIRILADEMTVSALRSMTLAGQQ